jgi:altronate dehydratase
MSDVATETTASVIRLNPSDNVVVAAARIPAGALVPAEDVRSLEAIPFGHKLAVRGIAAGDSVLKYGQAIGVATEDIAAGAHVHVHNLAVSDLRLAAEAPAWTPRNEEPRRFMGFRRADGRVGTRNYVGVLTSVNCSATVARLIAEAADRSACWTTIRTSTASSRSPIPRAAAWPVTARASTCCAGPCGARRPIRTSGP